ncbi:MAG: helix-turn-helix domain-containing protein [Pseudomonadota bacterium]
MEQDPAYKNVLEVFAQYGFRKTSMAELAEAAGVSRQTLYNRFQSKEAVLGWAMTGYSDAAEAAAEAALADETLDPETRLISFFREWIGHVVPKMRQFPHFNELLEASAAQHQATEDPFSRIGARLSRFLHQHGFASSEEQASETAFVVMMASKGLIFKSATVEDYEESMRRVIRVFRRVAPAQADAA